MKEIHELSGPELELLYEKKIQQCIIAGKEWAEKKAVFESFEDKRKPVLSSIMGKTEGSQAAKEQFAYAHTEYSNFLSVLSEARRDFLLCQVTYDMAKVKIEAIRSILATRREEMKSLK